MLMQKNRIVFVLCSALSVCIASATQQPQAATIGVQKLIHEVSQEVAAVQMTIDKPVSKYNDQELLALIDLINARHQHSMSPSNIAKMAIAKSMIIQILKDYRVTGVSFCVDPNIAFILDEQNPTFTVHYKDKKGHHASRVYESSINSIGLKFELSLKFNMIIFTNTDFNFFETNKNIELGYGIDISGVFGGGLGFTYTPFRNAPGGMFILSFIVGSPGGALSLVTGGKLMPQSMQ